MLDDTRAKISKSKKINKGKEVLGAVVKRTEQNLEDNSRLNTILAKINV